MIYLENVRKSYEETIALDGLDIDVPQGSIRALLGPNGAGKTTTMSILVGLVQPDSGRVSVCGIDPMSQPRSVRRLIGYAPQDLGIYPNATVARNLRLFAELRDIPRRRLTSEVDRVATALSLEGLMSRRASALSGGEKRRLHTAMAMTGEPQVLLLDEPTVGADVPTRARLLEQVAMLRSRGTTVLYSTHYLAEVESLNADVTLIVRGRVALSGTLADMMTRANLEPTVLVRFIDYAPEVRTDRLIERGPDWLKLRATSANSAVEETLGVLDGRRDEISALDVIRPSLDQAYLSITGASALDNEANQRAQRRELWQSVRGASAERMRSFVMRHWEFCVNPCHCSSLSSCR